ncbi:hypothetical protein PFICI_10748 [Pestalotiopsis fici W106-1]|uniref:Uncharacterized protein n=1 Tax=Pestalotiopsis fici (strain W106-1 / CGMCC3.15140) TaxID=1229662 RepID=W3WST7_PESFW|nr:uncharacterized protein PFICI_10748 [Pestalotiopsis fici W106-1]ETS76874.1 hypothetical protein PFICI_10748 [Pestalotiopsis fici W106-1]
MSQRVASKDLANDEEDTTSSSDEEDLYDEEEVLGFVLRSERLPPEHQLRHDHVRSCVVAGIRRNLDFAKSRPVRKLCASKADEFPMFARARNARLIMSNKIPRMNSAESYPYCIWYPDLATEQTYADLAKQYPAMRYQVGRACAVAGYNELYKSLELLPDVSIAEEAQDNKTSGGEIFDLIMASPVKYAVMNDYERTINLENPHAAYLNNDAAVRSKFDLRDPDEEGTLKGHWATMHWDITEDWLRQDINSRIEVDDPPLQPEYAHLLYSPLPLDLPPINKDLLILTAAYEGNVDRYARLRRPHLIQDEAFCVIRGIHHSAAFARWWSGELAQGLPERCGSGDHPSPYKIRNISMAINARYIMSNDIARISNAPKNHLPYMIWYPHRPHQSTLQEVVRVQPEMKQAVAHACIVCNYRRLWDKLRPDPHPVLYREAKQCAEPYYVADLEARAKEQGIFLGGEMPRCHYPQARALAQDKEPTSTFLHGLASTRLIDTIGEADFTRQIGFYGDGSLLSVTRGRVDLFICATENARAVAARQVGGWRMPLDWVEEEHDE